MHLNYFHSSVGSAPYAWRRPEADFPASLTIDGIARLAQIAERACFDSLFVAHTLGSHVGVGHSTAGLQPDPLCVLSAVAARTQHIGLLATRSTTFMEPYLVAQEFASLDHLSGGRAGWNIVTSFNQADARNFGMQSMPDHDARYARAAEFVDVCLKLWDSWDDHALLIDKAGGVLADADRVHTIDHKGESFDVQGPLTLPPSPQRHPLLVQAGASDAGRDFSARYAEVVFTAVSTIAEAEALRGDMNRRLARYGREPSALKIMPGLSPLLGPTESAARTRQAELAEMIVPEQALGSLAILIHRDLRGHPLDGPVPPLPSVEGFRGSVTFLRQVHEYVARERPTLRQLAIWAATNTLGHQKFVGTAEQLADTMEQWVQAGVADGFTLIFPLVPASLEEFAADVVPILQERNLVRTDFSPGATVRENYGLPVRPSRSG